MSLTFDKFYQFAEIMKLAIFAVFAAASAQDLNSSAWQLKDQLDTILPNMEESIMDAWAQATMLTVRILPQS